MQNSVSTMMQKCIYCVFYSTCQPKLSTLFIWLMFEYDQDINQPFQHTTSLVFPFVNFLISIGFGVTKLNLVNDSYLDNPFSYDDQVS